MPAQYLIANYAQPLTANPVPVATGATLKTMLQVKLGAAWVINIKVKEWGILFDAAGDAAKVNCWLGTTDVKTVAITEHVASGIVNLSNPLSPVTTDDNPFAFGVAGNETGYTATDEGVPTVARTFDPQLVSPAGGYVKQYPLGNEPEFDRDEYLRVRVLAPVTVGCLTYVILEI